MLLADLGVMLFIGWLLYLLFMPVEKVSLKLVFFWIAVILFCMGGWVLSLGFIVLMTVFFIIINL